jgi:ubiquinol-cytochrome c reductase cytochrome c1 subunit
MRKLAIVLLAMGCLPVAALAAEPVKAEPVKWEEWHAGNSIEDTSSLQRGARNFMNYCNGCHALKYVRYQRMADDLKIPTDVLSRDLVAPGSNALSYITTSARCRPTCR